MQLLLDFKNHFSTSKKEMYKLITKILDENEELREENNNFKNDYLYTENQMLKDKNKELDNLCFKLTQESGLATGYIKELEVENLELINDNLILKSDIGNITLENQMYSEKIEELTERLEIKERLETDKPLEEDYYNTKDLENNLLINTIDKITEERNAYKEIINVMCDKFEIPTDAVLDILDDIQTSKGQQIDKTL